MLKPRCKGSFIKYVTHGGRQAPPGVRDGSVTLSEFSAVAIAYCPGRRPVFRVEKGWFSITVTHKKKKKKKKKKLVTPL